MKKLIPSLCMLLISAAMLCTSSYAWFSMNKTVTATGMSVTAQTASTLLIDTASSVDTNGKLESGTATKTRNPEMTSAASIAPASTVDGESWFTAVAAEASEKDAQEGAYEAIASDVLDSYRLASTFYLQLYDATKTGDSDQLLYVDSITVSHAASTDPNDKLSECFRVLIVLNDGTDDTLLFCNPVSTTTPTNQGVSAVSSGVATFDDITYTAVSSITSSKATLEENTLVETVEYNKVYTANVYIFFDGEDEDCYTDNIPKTLNDYNITVSFSIKNIPAHS